jgi:hypothetical protein
MRGGVKVQPLACMMISVIHGHLGLLPDLVMMIQYHGGVNPVLFRIKFASDIDCSPLSPLSTTTVTVIYLLNYSTPSTQGLTSACSVLSWKCAFTPIDGRQMFAQKERYRVTPSGIVVDW